MIQQAVTEKLPKYSPSSSKSAREEETRDSPDILRLPTITVTAESRNQPTDFAMLTSKARLERAMKSKPGIRIGNIFGSNTGIALAMLADEREVERKQSVKETVMLTRSDNGPESRRIDRLLKDALARPSMAWAGDKGP